MAMVKPDMAPLLIPVHPPLPQLPGTNLEHPTWDWLSLVAIILSGTSQQQDCHLTSPTSSVHQEKPAHNQHTKPHLKNGLTSAADGSLISTNQF